LKGPNRYQAVLEAESASADKADGRSV
jgi:hypothetical protein